MSCPVSVSRSNLGMTSQGRYVQLGGGERKERIVTEDSTMDSRL